MPLIELSLIEGYSTDVKEQLLTDLGDIVRNRIGAPKEGVVAIIREMKQDAYMRGGTLKNPVPPPSAPRLVVQNFLNAMDERDLETAQKFLASDIVMTFPGGKSFTELKHFVNWANGRYEKIRKSVDRIDCSSGDDGVTVICQGTLEGLYLNGNSFKGIRFMDWFRVVDGLIVEQKVCNDMAVTH